MLRYAHLVQLSRQGLLSIMFFQTHKENMIHGSCIQIHYFDAKAIIFLMLVPYHNLILYLELYHSSINVYA